MRRYGKYRRYMRREKRIHRQERSFHRWLAVFMAAVLLMSESNLTVLAEEVMSDEEVSEEAYDEISMEETDADNEDDAEGEDEQPHEEGDAAADDIGDADEDNKGGVGVGADDVNDGEGLPDEDNADEKSCSCKSRCSEDMVNEDCPVCVEDYGSCIRQENDESIAENEEIVADSEDEGIETYAIRAKFIDFTDEQGIMYRIIKDDENDRQVEVTSRGAGFTLAVNEVKIPETVYYNDNKYGVTSIGAGAFNSYSITSIEIPDSVTSIGESAFVNCKSLKSIKIPNSVTSIGWETFAYCSSLKSVEIPNSVTSIDNYAFFYCSSLTDIKIPDSVTSIGECAFEGCSSLKSIEIPDGVTSISQSVFAHCSSLSSIEIPDSVTSIEDNAFSECSSLKSIEIPDGVTSISNSAFYFCYNLTSIKIPNGVTSIGGMAFWGCQGLSTLRIVVPSDGTGIIVPEVDNDTFGGIPSDCYIVFITEDGSPLTGSALEAARAAYKADDDGDTSDDLWWGWKLKKPDISSSITINVHKDNSDWSDHTRKFALQSETNPAAALITDLTKVVDGQYKIFDITNVADGTSGIDTEETITISGGAGEATVDYYTVTFYDGSTAYEANTPQAMQTVLKGQAASEPSEQPSRTDHQFKEWVTEKGGSNPFDFENTEIEVTTSVYASWISNVATEYYISASSGEGGSISPVGNVRVQEGGTQTFEITPDEGYRIKNVAVDGMNRTDELTDSASARAIRAQAEASRYYTFVDVRESHTIRATFEKESGNTGDSGNTGTGDNTGTGGSGGDGGNTETGGSSGTDSSNGSGDNNNTDADDNAVINISNEDGAENAGSPAENSNLSTTSGDTRVINSNNNSTNNNSANNSASNPSKDKEPKTGDTSQVEIYATVAMIAGLTYLLLYFADKEKGMTEEKKQELVSSMIGWAKRGRRIRKYIVLVPIFILLCYYHSIGKRIEVEWDEEPVWAEL